MKIHTIGELRKLMPNLVKDENYKTIPENDDCCLCPIDLPKTAKANGFDAHLKDGDYIVIPTN